MAPAKANIKPVKLGGESTSWSGAYGQTEWKKIKTRVKQAAENWLNQLVAVNPEKLELVLVIPEKQEEHSVATAEASRVSKTALLHPQTKTQRS